MGTILPLIIQLIGGAAGGHGIGALLKQPQLSTAAKTIAGIIGGVGGGQLAGLLPALQGLLGGDGGSSMLAALIGNAGASAIGGGLLTFIVGLIKQAIDKPKAV